MTAIAVVLLTMASFPTSAYVGASMGNPHILVVCSDIEDVMFANSLALRGSFAVDILYLGKDLPDDRSKLFDVTYLVRYDEIWIPDLNIDWTYGGRLKRAEIDALMEYVEYGGVLVFGFNTYTQHWNRKLDDLFGVRLLRIEKASVGEDGWDILHNNRTYPYDPTFQEAIVNPNGASVYARYLNGNPAVTVSRYGRGVAVLMTFNPVKEFAAYGLSTMEFYVGIANSALSQRLSPPSIPLLKILAMELEGILLDPLSLAVITFLLLEVLAYYGFLPLGITAVLAVPFLPFARWLFLHEPYKSVLNTVQTLRGATLKVLSKKLGTNPRRLKFPLVLLRLKRKASFIDLSSFGSRDTLIVVYGQEAEGMASWALEHYPRLMEKVANNPGITIIDLAHGVGMPPYDVLNIMRDLSRYGVVELRKIVVDYEVHPTPALLRWFEA